MIKQDSTSFFNIESNQFMNIRTTEVKCVECRDVTGGAVGGLLMGLLGGLIAGFTAFFLVTDGNSQSEDMSGLIIIAGPLLGGSIGLVIGAIKQDRKIYYLNGVP